MYGGVQHILSCVFVLFVFVLLPALPVSLDCPFLIAPSVFSNVYLNNRLSIYTVYIHSFEIHTYSLILVRIVGRYKRVDKKP